VQDTARVITAETADEESLSSLCTQDVLAVAAQLIFVQDDYGGFWPGRYEMDVEPTSGWPDPPDRFREHLVFTVEPGSEIRDALRKATAPLATADSVIVAPQSYYHVTVTIAGNLVDPGTEDGPGEFDPSSLEQLRADAREALAETECEPCEAPLPRLNLFPTVVFCEVDDGGTLSTLNTELCDVPGVPEHDRDIDYIPHVTLGHFVQTDIGELLKTIEQERRVESPPLSIDAVELIGMQFDQQYPERRTIERFPLS
jgi:2'-5' RNA ligase